MSSTSFTLLQRVRRKEDQAAWVRFVEIYTPLLLRWSQRAGMAEQDAVDLVQDVFATLATEPPRFEYDAARGPFRAWLKTVTVNKCRERQRKKPVALGRGGEEDPLAAVPGADALEAFWDAEYYAHVRQRALEIMQSQFEPKTWQAAWELTTNGLSAADVAKKLGLSEAAVYVAKSRVLRRLRQELAGLLD